MKYNKGMKTLGIICEYNPFHKGHKYHIDESKNLTGADTVVCLMSGDFVQRGDPAIISKWARAESAISGGADLVLELPVIFSTASAETFSFGALSILDSLGVIDVLSFGSECNELSGLKEAASFLSSNPEEYIKSLKDHLKQGLSYPAARARAVNDIDKELSCFLKGSNNVLAIEYLKSLIKLRSDIKPFTIKRISSDYKALELQGQFSSASSIRSSIFDGIDVKDMLPSASYKLLSSSIHRSIDDFSDILMYLIRMNDLDDLNLIDYMNDGIAQIFKKQILKTNDINKLISLSLNKRHTETRIKRALINLLLGITSKIRMDLLSEDKRYIRVLALNEKGADILHKAKNNGKTVIVTKAANYKQQLSGILARSFELDLLASDIYSNIKNNYAVSDITKSPVKLL